MGRGLRTPDVIQQAFGVSGERLRREVPRVGAASCRATQGQFMLTERAKPLEDAKKLAAAAPNDANAHFGLALALLHAHKVDEAKKEIDAALKIDPKHPNAHYSRRRFSPEPDESRSAPQGDAEGGGRRIPGADGLADVAEAKKDPKAKRAALEAAYRFDPIAARAAQGLFDSRQGGEARRRRDRSLEEAHVLEQHDRQAWRVLLDKLVDAKRLGRGEENRRSSDLRRRRVAPARTWRTPARSALGAHAGAKFELESALACNPKDESLGGDQSLSSKRRRTRSSILRRALRIESLILRDDAAVALAPQIPAAVVANVEILAVATIRRYTRRRRRARSRAFADRRSQGRRARRARSSIRCRRRGAASVPASSTMGGPASFGGHTWSTCHVSSGLHNTG